MSINDLGLERNNFCLGSECPPRGPFIEKSRSSIAFCRFLGLRGIQKGLRHYFCDVFLQRPESRDGIYNHIYIYHVVMRLGGHHSSSHPTPPHRFKVQTDRWYWLLRLAYVQSCTTPRWREAMPSRMVFIKSACEVRMLVCIAWQNK